MQVVDSGIVVLVVFFVGLSVGSDAVTVVGFFVGLSVGSGLGTVIGFFVGLSVGSGLVTVVVSGVVSGVVLFFIQDRILVTLV